MLWRRCVRLSVGAVGRFRVSSASRRRVVRPTLANRSPAFPLAHPSLPFSLHPAKALDALPTHQKRKVTKRAKFLEKIRVAAATKMKSPARPNGERARSRRRP